MNINWTRYENGLRAYIDGHNVELQRRMHNSANIHAAPRIASWSIVIDGRLASDARTQIQAKDQALVAIERTKANERILSRALRSGTRAKGHHA